MPAEPQLPPPFLRGAPPHWAARGLAYLLILLFVIAVVFVVVLRVPETVSGPFVLQPLQGADPVRASRSGTVSQVRITEGQSVNKGELLFVIQSGPAGDRSAELRSLETQMSGIDQSLSNLKRESESQRQADAQETERLQKRQAFLPRAIDFKREQLKLTREVASRYHELYEQGLTGWAEYAERELEISKVSVEQGEFETELEENQAALDRIRHESAVKLVQSQEQDRRLREERDKALIRMAALRKELVHTDTNELSELAPCAGTILRLQVKAFGAYVPEGAVLCELVCGGGQLQAELTVPQGGLGRLKPGQGVKLLYEAFPYQRYGARYGTVRRVSPSSLTVDNADVFHAVVELADREIWVEGQPRPLKAGMRGTAQVVVGRPRLITYAFEPLRQLRESLAEPPGKQ